MKFLRLVLTLLSALCPALLPAQNFTSVLVFGDSLSDTGNVAHLTQAKSGIRIPAPAAGYTDGRFTDGSDTVPSTGIAGVWVEQLAASLSAHPPVKNSLDGGTNYAYGYAFTGTGTTSLSFPAAPALAVDVENIGQQVTDYLSTHPHVPAGTLVILWGGANDVLSAISSGDPAAAQAGITTAVSGEITALQRLIAAGATDILIPNLPPLGAIPRLNGSSLGTAGMQASSAFNTALATGISGLPQNTAVHIYPLDTTGLFNRIITDPGTYKMTDTVGMSMGKPGVDPDAYIFWDNLHPTTAVHQQLAAAAKAAITRADSPSLTATIASTTLTVTGAATVTDVITLNPGGGFAGNVTFGCGNLPALTTCSFSPANVSFASTTAAQTATLTLSTDAGRPAAISAHGTSALVLLPLSGLGAILTLRRRMRFNPALFALLLTVAGAALLGLSGCSGKGFTADPATPAGTYTFPIFANPSGGLPATVFNLTLVVN